MDALQVDEFPQSSVAVHVLVTVSSAGQVPGVVKSAKVIVTTASQASVAVAKPKVGVNGQSIVSFGITGQVITGGVVSCTKMDALQVDEFPQSSVAVQVLVTVSSAGHVPGVVTSAKVIVTVASQASVAVANPKVGVNGQSIVSFGITGHVIKGAVVSCTKMDALQVDEFPQSSVAVQVLVTVSSAGHVPGVVTSAKVIVTSASQASVAVANPKVGTAGQSIVSFGITGQVITGAVVSCTRIVALQVDELPQSSVAVHVLVTVYSAGHAPGVVTSAKVIVTSASQASVAVANPKVGTAGQSIVSFGITGQVITGAVVSCTRIVALQVDELPQSSVAVHVLVTVYSAGHAPGVVTSSNVIVTAASHASVAVANSKVGVAGQSIVSFGITGQVITGAVVSCTRIVALQVDELPQSSVAVHVLVTVYSAGHAPGVVTSLNVIVTAASQASVAVANSKVGIAGQSIVSFAITGQVITGAVVSCTKIVALQVDEFPQESVAVHVLVTAYSAGQEPRVVTSS